MKKIIIAVICILLILMLIGCRKEEKIFVYDDCTVVSLNVGALEEFNKHYDLDIKSSTITLCSHEWQKGNDTIVFEGGYVLDDIPLTEAFCFIDKNNQQFSQGIHKNSFICE